MLRDAFDLGPISGRTRRRGRGERSRGLELLGALRVLPWLLVPLALSYRAESSASEAPDSQEPDTEEFEQGDVADPFAEDSVVIITAESLSEPVRPGGTVQAVLHLTIEPTWHVNSNQPYDEFLIPTAVTLSEDAPVALAGVRYPVAHDVELSFSEEPMAVYEGTVLIGLQITIPETAPDGQLAVEGIVTSQACDNAMCQPPTDQPFMIMVTVSETGAELAATASASSVMWDDSPPGAQGGFDMSRGLVVTYLLVFVGGLALNLTPCVYPMIPITISIFGAQGGGPRRALPMAIFYVFGMALTYSLLGTAAALTGGLLGSALQNPLVLAFVALVMVVLSLSMFGLYDIEIPQSLSRIAGGSHRGLLGALFMGATVGIIAAPCIGPFVLGLLTYVGASGNPALGFTLFFVLALGLGTPFLFLAVASGSLSALPRSGGWMVWVKKIFGFVLLGMALYFLTRSERLVPERFLFPLLAALSVVAALVLAVIDRTTSPGGGFLLIKRVTGVVFLALAIGCLVAPRFLAPPEGIEWSAYDEEALAIAVTDGRPVIIDFSAAWCIPCRELDHMTFAAAPVVERARSFVTLKADLTASGSPEVESLKERFQVLGVPTVVFLAPDGKEIDGLRFTGVIGPEEFLERMEQALDHSLSTSRGPGSLGGD